MFERRYAAGGGQGWREGRARVLTPSQCEPRARHPSSAAGAVAIRAGAHQMSAALADGVMQCGALWAQRPRNMAPTMAADSEGR